MRLMQVLMYIKSQARLSVLDYGGDTLLLQRDERLRNSQRYACKKYIDQLRIDNLQKLRPGSNYDGTFTVDDVSVRYIPNQFAPTEIWSAFHNYLKQTYGELDS